MCIRDSTYTRTKALFPEFVDALSQTDHVILADIYAARETNTLGISSRDLAEVLKEKGADTYYFPSFEEIEDVYKRQVQARLRSADTKTSSWILHISVWGESFQKTATYLYLCTPMPI